MSFLSSLDKLYLNNNSISSINVSGLREYLIKNKIMYLINNRVDIIFNCHYKWILEIFLKRSLNFYSGNSNIKWIIFNGYNMNNPKLVILKSRCLFQYFNNQESCGKEKIMLNNILNSYVLNCNKGNLLY